MIPPVPGETITLPCGIIVTVARVEPKGAVHTEDGLRFTPVRWRQLVSPTSPPPDKLAGADLRRPVRELAREYHVSAAAVYNARAAAGIKIPPGNRPGPKLGTVRRADGTEVAVAQVRRLWRRWRGGSRPAARVAAAAGITVEQVRIAVAGCLRGTTG